MIVAGGRIFQLHLVDYNVFFGRIWRTVPRCSCSRLSFHVWWKVDSFYGHSSYTGLLQDNPKSKLSRALAITGIS